MSFGIPVRNGLGLGLTPSTMLSSGQPGGRPALFLNFIGTTELDSRITFSRASTAAFVGSNGLIQTAAVDTPRFDYNPANLTAKGLLLEEQRTNLLIYSEQFDNAAWTKSNSTVTADATVSPDGTSNADKIVEAATTSIHDVRRNSTASASTAYTQSIFVKAAERTKIQLQMFGNTGGSTVNYDLVAGTVNVAGAYGGWSSSSGTITSFGNGWYRLTNTATTNVGLTAVMSAFLLADAAGNPTYTGDGTSGMFYWGAQLEAGAFATSYIPTVAAQVTRAGDIVTMTGANFSNWYSTSAGTFVMQFDSLYSGTPVITPTQLALTPLTGASGYVSYYNGAVVSSYDGTTVSNANIGVSNWVGPHSVASAYGSGAKIIYANGATLGSTAYSGAWAAATGLTTTPQGHIRSITYYPQRLPNATLQALTS